MPARVELTLLPNRENYCPNAIDTYGGIYKDGTIAQGGYSSHIRAHEYFTFKASNTFRNVLSEGEANCPCVSQIPDNVESEIAAPML